MYELELKMDEYILYDNTTYKRKDGMDEKLKPKWVNKRWSSKNGLPDYWGGCDEEGEVTSPPTSPETSLQKK